jgi:hypothetical protein
MLWELKLLFSIGILGFKNKKKRKKRNMKLSVSALSVRAASAIIPAAEENPGGSEMKVICRNFLLRATTNPVSHHPPVSVAASVVVTHKQPGGVAVCDSAMQKFQQIIKTYFCVYVFGIENCFTIPHTRPSAGGLLLAFTSKTIERNVSSDYCKTMWKVGGK